MTRSKVAILRTSPATVRRDYHELVNLAGYQDVLARDADTALEINISWHFFFPESSTTPWQLDGVISAMTRDGFSRDLIHACHNRTIVIDAHLGERENKQRPVRLAHDRGLGCGDPRELEIVGDPETAAENWHFVGPFQRMTFASRMQHQIYRGPLRTPIEWSLKTMLARAHIASVVYHDSYWYPFNAERRMRTVLGSPWGRLFQNWERVAATENGFPDVGEAPAEVNRAGIRALARSVGILGTCIADAPEFASRKRRAITRSAA